MLAKPFPYHAQAYPSILLQFLPRDALWCKARYCDLRLHDVRLSVGLSVTFVDQDHPGWKSWKLIAWTISLTASLFVAERPSTYSEGNMGKLEVRWEKVACWSTKVAISLKRVHIEETLLWRAYRKAPTLIQTVPSTTPYGLLFPKIGVHNPTQNFNRYYLRNG